MINLILFGKPGSGKGTQAEFVKQKYDLVHISTGDVFRYNISKNTDLGLIFLITRKNSLYNLFRGSFAMFGPAFEKP